jgi:hypothetical protein
MNVLSALHLGLAIGGHRVRARGKWDIDYRCTDISKSVALRNARSADTRVDCRSSDILYFIKRTYISISRVSDSINLSELRSDKMLDEFSDKSIV